MVTSMHTNKPPACLLNVRFLHCTERFKSGITQKNMLLSTVRQAVQRSQTTIDELSTLVGRKESEKRRLTSELSSIQMKRDEAELARRALSDQQVPRVFSMQHRGD